VEDSFYILNMPRNWIHIAQALNFVMQIVLLIEHRSCHTAEIYMIT